MNAMTKITPITDGSPAAPRDIAASVRRGAQHQVLEHRLAALRTKRDELVAAMAEVRERSWPQIQRDREVNKLAIEHAGVEQQIREVRGQLVDHRRRHGVAVTAALAPVRSRLAGEALDALHDAERVIALLNEAAAAIRVAGGDAPTLRANVRRLRRALGALE